MFLVAAAGRTTFYWEQFSNSKNLVFRIEVKLNDSLDAAR